jgi:hypothetical protein
MPSPDLARSPDDHTGEPVGLNLGDVPLYEQPPTPSSPAWREPVPRPLPAGEALAGFCLSFAGLVSLPFLSPLAMGMAATGTLSCAVALVRSRRVGMRLRGLAIAGLVLGIVVLVVSLLLAANVATDYAIEIPR